MATEVYRPDVNSKGQLERIAPRIAGMAIGGYFGGPTGAAVGGEVGGSLGEGFSKSENQANVSAPETSSPAARKMEAVEGSDTEVLRRGRAALSKYDEETQAAIAPALDEALRRAAENQKMGRGYGG